MIDTTRRQWLAAAAAVAATPALAAATKAGTPSLSGPFIDLATPEGNARAYARISGSLNPDVTSYSWYSGRVSGHRPGEAGRDLMNIIGMGAVRLLPLAGEPGWVMLRKELGFFTDAAGQVLDRWQNPYTEEEVEVVHLANPAINSAIKPFVREQGLYETVGAPDKVKPFLLPWQQVGDRAMTEIHAHIRAKNPLDPAKWPRESSGAEVSISDANSFTVALADLQNAALQKVESIGNWVHSRPWQPWMLMGQADGNIQYTCFTGSSASLDRMPARIVALARERYPDFLEAPREITKAESSLARYMRTRTPAPPK
ncbi:DUF1838 family protein [Polymorphobacter sp.]|uniref:DUF1838 family protein n=1 Tax=Polymorphobacter sp. TaxID=1909290 RepID=UPI003F721733